MGRSTKRVLLLHGFPGTPAELLPLAEFFVAQGFEAHAPLLPGFGLEIERLGQTPWQDWVAAARGAWDALQDGAETALLLGFSVGGAVALRVAAEAGVRPDRLVLIAPFWRLNDPRAALLPLVRHVMPQLKPFQHADFTTDVVRAQFERLEPTLNLDDPEVERELRDKVSLPTASLVQLQRLGRAAFGAAPQLSTPTLIVQGAADTTVAPADTRRLALRLGGPLTLIELADAGHQLIEAQGIGHGALLEQLRATSSEQ